MKKSVVHPLHHQTHDMTKEDEEKLIRLKTKWRTHDISKVTMTMFSMTKIESKRTCLKNVESLDCCVFP